MRQAAPVEWERAKHSTYSPGIIAGDFVYLSGLGAFDGEGRLLHPGDVVGQAEATYANVAAVLSSVGLTLDHVIKTTDYIVEESLSGYAGTKDLRERLFTPPYPAATGVVVKGLLRRGMLIEVDVVAYRYGAGSGGDRAERGG